MVVVVAAAAVAVSLFEPAFATVDGTIAVFVSVEKIEDTVVVAAAAAAAVFARHFLAEDCL